MSACFDVGVLWLTFSCRLQKLLGDVIVSQGGVVPFIQPEVCDSSNDLDCLLTGLFAAFTKQVGEGQEGVARSLIFLLLLFPLLSSAILYHTQSVASSKCTLILALVARVKV